MVSPSSLPVSDSIGQERKLNVLYSGSTAQIHARIGQRSIPKTARKAVESKMTPTDPPAVKGVKQTHNAVLIVKRTSFYDWADKNLNQSASGGIDHDAEQNSCIGIWQNCCGRSVRFVAVHRVPWSDNDSFCIIT